MTAPTTPSAPAVPAAARTHPGAARLLRLLTPREARALARLAAGEDIPAIAAALGVAPGTARVHLHRAMRKLGVRTREEAVAVAAAASPVPEAVTAPRPATFEALCTAAHTRLVQQTFLLTASRHRAVHSVRLALSAASRRWREVSALPDPEAWVRAYAFETALAPWHRGGPRRARSRQLPRRRIKVRPAGQDREPRPGRLRSRDKSLLKALRRLSRRRRRALVLHDSLGLSAAEVAAEMESSTAAAEGRVRAGRAGLARSVPELVGPDPWAPDFGERLGGLLYEAAVQRCPAPRQPSPLLLKVRGRVRSGLVTGAAALMVLVMGAAIVSTLAGNGPSTLFRPPAPAPPPLCSGVHTGSAGPAAPGLQAGLRSPWCGTTPGHPAQLVAPPPPHAARGAATGGR
ncbi:hypothetical protein GCM10010193_53680 [Kitasatospora atroaurantiaca]|uniref:Sigma-70-like protein n=1 Tax=Kitasatospora atroaurantiaca TaxID=285545 RepID=A0A561EQ55_9ACTN|nr:sigma factor-like helix-turn-helix DNA-binding protein [Kitasatospora atroaurantiaca]TWE17742.1 sigma-70-like protein [Kitasatospora atroaurantiaca]